MRQLIASIAGSDPSGPLNPARQLARLVPLSADRLAALPQDRVVAALAIIDPSFDARERSARERRDVTADVTSRRMEAAQREGMKIAYLTRFTTDQLRGIDAFFATPTGMVYAANARAIESDPAVVTRTRDVVFEEAKVAANDRPVEFLPPPRALADLTLAELVELAAVLGVAPATLK